MSYKFIVVVAMLLANLLTLSRGDGNDGWEDASATFYGDINGSGTMYGACGYGDLFKQGYGLATTALSSALFNDGLICGACFEVKCVNSPQWCKSESVNVTATNFCPSSSSNSDGNWCNPPRKHFDLSMKMFENIAIKEAGIIPVKYRRVLCYREGGVKFEIKGNPYWISVLLYNVGTVGDITNVAIKGTNSDWTRMARSWGQIWETSLNLVGQSLSFKATNSDGKTVEFNNVAPFDWQFDQTYDGIINF